MSLPLELQRLGQSIIDAQEMRVKAIGGLVLKAAQALRDFRLEQEGMIAELRDLLAKTESLRKKDFDTMMDDIIAQRKEREMAVIGVLERFGSEGGRMIAELRRFLNQDGCLRLDEFAKLKEAILTEQERREKEVAEVLREFHREQEELNTALRKLLSRGVSVRVRDFKSTIRALQVQRKEGQGELGDVLKELERVRDAVAEDWHGVMVRQRRGASASR